MRRYGKYKSVRNYTGFVIGFIAITLKVLEKRWSLTQQLAPENCHYTKKYFIFNKSFLSLVGFCEPEDELTGQKQNSF